MNEYYLSHFYNGKTSLSIFTSPSSNVYLNATNECCLNSNMINDGMDYCPGVNPPVADPGLMMYFLSTVDTFATFELPTINTSPSYSLKNPYKVSSSLQGTTYWIFNVLLDVHALRLISMHQFGWF